MIPLLYLDTSAAVPVIVREAATERTRAFLKEREAEGIAVSPWVVTEFASALAGKLRTGALTKSTYAGAALQWQAFLEGVRSLAVERGHFEKAALLCQRQELGLRAGDALHLAIAAGAGCTLVTLDERMAKAAPELGVPVAVL